MAKEQSLQHVGGYGVTHGQSKSSFPTVYTRKDEEVCQNSGTGKHGDMVWTRQSSSETSCAELLAVSTCEASFRCYPSATWQISSASPLMYYFDVTPALPVSHKHAPCTKRAPEPGLVCSLFPFPGFTSTIAAVFSDHYHHWGSHSRS